MPAVLGGSLAVAKGGVVLLIGVALLAGGYHVHQGAQKATETAVEVEGTVLSSTVERHEEQDDDGTDVEYSPHIEYRYTYEGKTYTSSSICPGSIEGCPASDYRADREEVEEIVSRYPEGEPVTVYVVPDDPSTSFLVKTDSGEVTYLFMMGIGGVLTFGGLVAVLGGVKSLLVG